MRGTRIRARAPSTSSVPNRAARGPSSRSIADRSGSAPATARPSSTSVGWAVTETTTEAELPSETAAPISSTSARTTRKTPTGSHCANSPRGSPSAFTSTPRGTSLRPTRDTTRARSAASASLARTGPSHARGLPRRTRSEASATAAWISAVSRWAGSSGPRDISIWSAQPPMAASRLLRSWTIASERRARSGPTGPGTGVSVIAFEYTSGRTPPNTGRSASPDPGLFEHAHDGVLDPNRTAAQPVSAGVAGVPALVPHVRHFAQRPT